MKNLMPLVLLNAMFISSTVHAWSQHGLLTREALSGLQEIQGLEALYEPLENVLARMELYYREQAGSALKGTPGALLVKTPSQLNLYLQIKRDSANRHAFIFEPRLNEKSGQKIKAIDVLSHYADEPDGWNDLHEGDEPDTYLFEDGQYPHLWKPEYSMLGGKEGTASQAFRHMWWSPLDAFHPLASFKLPFGMIKKSMGTADERIQAFVELARAAKKAQSTYWQLRFLSNALHFIQDCTQPFHVTQTPTKKFIWMATPPGGWKGASFKMDAITKRTTQLVSYYHWSYEDLIGRIFKNPGKYPTAHKQFAEALRKPGKFKKVANPAEYLREVAKTSINRSPVAAKTAIDFFPKIPKSSDLAGLDPHGFMNDAWWAEVEVSAEKNSRSRRKYFESVRESFQLFGESVRNVVVSELK